MLCTIKTCHTPPPNPGSWDWILTSWLESPIHKEEFRRTACTVRKACWKGSVMLTRCMWSFWHSLRASVQDRVFRIILYRLFRYFTVSEVLCKLWLLSTSVCKRKKKTQTTQVIWYLKIFPSIMYFRYYTLYLLICVRFGVGELAMSSCKP